MGFSSWGEFLVFLAAFLLSVSFHEAAHGFIAFKMGDPTAKHLGRITLNPLKHIDPLGALAFLLIGIGWARPVPVNPHNFHDYRQGMMFTSLAGPASNFLLALTAGAFLNFAWPYFVYQFLYGLLWINAVLMIFNLLPLAPLDGEKIFGFFVPKKGQIAWDELQKSGPLVLIILIAVEKFFNLAIFEWLIIVPAQKIVAFILLISGLG